MKKFTTIRQSDLSVIQRCHHLNTERAEAYMDLSVDFCKDCGSIIIQQMEDSNNIDSEWVETVIDPFSVYKLFSGLDITYFEVKKETTYVHFVTEYGDVWYFRDRKIRLVQAELEMKSQRDKDENGYYCNDIFDGVKLLRDSGDIKGILVYGIGVYPFGVKIKENENGQKK